MTWFIYFSQLSVYQWPIQLCICICFFLCWCHKRTFWNMIFFLFGVRWKSVEWKNSSVNFQYNFCLENFDYYFVKGVRRKWRDNSDFKNKISISFLQNLISFKMILDNFYITRLSFSLIRYKFEILKTRTQI